jgi:hypothetical protein
MPLTTIARVLLVGCALIAPWTSVLPIDAAPQVPPPELPPADPELPEARTLLGQAALALGTAERSAAIESYRIEASLEVVTAAQAPRPELRTRYQGALMWRRDGHALWRATADGVSARTWTVYPRRFESGVRPDVMWSRFPESGPNAEPDPNAGRNVRLPRAQAAGDVVAAVDPLRLLYAGLARHAECVLEPRTTKREQRRGRDCHRIDARLRYAPAEGVQRVTLWLDVSQSRLVEVAGGTTVLYDDWRDVDGVLVPYRFSASPFCGERSLRSDRMASVTGIAFNTVTAEEIVAPADLADLSELVPQE